MKNINNFDVIVIGGGHAGAETAGGAGGAGEVPPGQSGGAPLDGGP